MSSILRKIKLKNYHHHYNSCLHWNLIKTRNYHSSEGVFGFKPRKVSQVSFNADILKNRHQNAHIVQLVDAFRSKGHLLAPLNPLQIVNPRNESVLEVDLNNLNDEQAQINTHGILNIGKESCKVNEILSFLRRTYCSPAAVEFMHIECPNEREWVANRWESLSNDFALNENEKKNIAKTLLKSEIFDQFVGTKFSSVKRYGGEGAESMMIFFGELFRLSALNEKVTDLVVGMPHRGRLNFMVGLLNYPPVIMFQKMKGLSEFDLSSVTATGDVLSHLFTSVDLKFDNQHDIHVSVLPNPSHLEAICPAAAGKARGKAMSKSVGQYGTENGHVSPILAIQGHGDAAITGQGVVMETLSMANVPHFSVDGSIHLIVNNQIGYTTPGHNRGRSTEYCSDIMKSINAPIIHVNADYPEEVVKATRFAFEYRQEFGKDIAVDLICYRQWGHNELDDPTFTNPLMYKEIRSRQTVPQKYAQKVLNEEEKKSLSDEYYNYLNEQLKQAESYKPVNTNLKGVWNKISMASNNSISTWDTGVSSDILLYIGAKSIETPENFNLHKTLNKVLSERLNRIKEGTRIDWATAELLAIGSLLQEGFNVRISGQDVGRGTFSQRHAMLVDQESEEMYIPLNKIDSKQKGFFEVANSILSEEAVLAFEWGLSIENPNNLVIWEAQFGDFFNGAQIMLDTLISSGETKWLLNSAITLLLPHGYDGAGPEHSSCHIERFLQNCDSKELGMDCDNINWSICYPTTPAQHFHLIRRQMIRNFRKPLIIAGPKMLLRHPQCVSLLSHFNSPTFFKPLLSDPEKPNAELVESVVFCSGKHFYTLDKERHERNIRNVALIRLEELCPFPANEIANVLHKYKNAKTFIWSQEEQQNMGAWSFVNPRFKNNFNCELKYAGRPPLGTPAVGIGELHKRENAQIIDKTFANP